MKRIRLNYENWENYLITDTNKIVAAFKKLGYDITFEQAYLLWEMYSEYCSATWLFLPDNEDHILKAARKFFDIELEEETTKSENTDDKI